MKTALRPRLEQLESRDTPAFAPLPPFGAFGQTSAIATADLNGDDFADVAIGQIVNTLGAPSVNIQLGNGDGTFAQFQELSLPAAPRSISIADLNADGHKDLAVASWDGAAGGGVIVFLGQADGSFNTTTFFQEAVPSIALGVEDFNNDGILDIVSLNPDNVSVIGGYRILAGDGVGGFAILNAQPSFPFDVERVATGDFDLDGHKDFIALDNADRLMFTFFGDGTGNFTVPSPGFSGLTFPPFDVATGDFDGDGLSDLILSTAAGVTFHKNLGTRQFDLVGIDLFTISGTTPSRLAAADVDKNSVADIIATDPQQARIFYGSLGTGFTEDPTSPQAIPGATAFNDVAIGDVNGDTHPDFVVARRSGTAVIPSDGRAFINLAPVPTSTSISANPNPVTEGFSTTLSATVIFPGNPFPFGSLPNGLMSFDLNNAFFGTANIVNGTATLPANLPAGVYSVVARFAGSGPFLSSFSENIPLFVIPPGGGNEGTATYSFEVTGLPTLPGLGADRVASGNFTNDEVSDIALASGPGRPASLSLINGQTRAEITSIAPFGDGFTGGLMVAAGDIDGDGTDDVAVAADIGGGPRVTIYRVRNGTLQITNNFFALDDAFRGGLRIALGDVDGDGHADLVVTGGPGAGPRVATYDGNTLTNFQTPQRLFNDFFAMDPDSRLGLFVAVGDLNGDGRAEIAVSSDFGGGPRILIFDGQSLIDESPDSVADFFAGDPNARGGLRIAIRDISSSEGLELVAGDGPGAGSSVRVYSGFEAVLFSDPEPLITSELMPGYLGGVFVA